MKKIVYIMIKAIIPMIIVLCVELLVSLPEYFNIVLYIILFSIINEIIEKNRKALIKKSFKKGHYTIAVMISFFSLILLIFLKGDFLQDFTWKRLIQLAVSLIFSISAIIFFSESYIFLQQKMKATGENKYGKNTDY